MNYVKPYLSNLYEKSSDSFVFTDDAGKIIEANESFLTLCEAPSADQIMGFKACQTFSKTQKQM